MRNEFGKAMSLVTPLKHTMAEIKAAGGVFLWGAGDHAAVQQFNLNYTKALSALEVSDAKLKAQLPKLMTVLPLAVNSTGLAANLTNLQKDITAAREEIAKLYTELETPRSPVEAPPKKVIPPCQT